MIRTTSKFVPRVLTEEQKNIRMDVCKNMVEMTRTDSEWMQKIINGDETWVYQYDPETKRQSSQWIERGEPKPKKARCTKSKVCNEKKTEDLWRVSELAWKIAGFMNTSDNLILALGVKWPAKITKVPTHITHYRQPIREIFKPESPELTSQEPVSAPLPTAELPQEPSGEEQQAPRKLLLIVRSSNWLSFREIFNSTINSNQTLTEIQKFQYLNASVKGPAEKLIRGFPISDRNYQQAWDTLCNRFNNRRELAFSQINKIFSIRPLKSITTGSLYEILDVCNEGIRNLSVLGLEENTLTDIILINFFEKRIGEALRKEWELTLQNKEYPTFENLVKFLEKHARSLQGMIIPLFQEQKTSSKNMMAHGLYVNKGQNCILCHQIHKLNDCHRFINLPLPKKWELVKRHKLCQNCLRANHEISKCLITSRCKNCKKNHHTLLHEYNSEPSIPQPTTSQEMLISTNTIYNVMPLEKETNILLSTALIKVKAKDGSFVLCRALVDNGSQICLISEQCCHKLGLEKMKNSYTLKGVGDIVVNRTTSQVEIEFTPHHNDQLFSARAFVVGRVTADLPNFQIQSADFPHLENLLLADPEFYVTKPIDLILGADTFVEIILGHKTDLKHHPIALNTKLGWLVSGRIHSNIKSNTSVINHCTTELDSNIRKFWELEDVPISKAQLGTKNACEILFKSNLKRFIEGRYSVNLPFKSTPNLGDSRSQALRRFFNLEKKATG
ncbi:hypothetical protein LAZ67_11001122 [Cordylochernes scorpioides]|uniref:Peptidase aspartic putative domain-containing protein n=1 Tax=Cordylochernes scorpioides TaxID=51811 RepID=A0ABY6L0K1_9ARAC|nr:hypothetical protein LAZ67_11001122 [Cordylochernes scorpioides]